MEIQISAQQLTPPTTTPEQTLFFPTFYFNEELCAACMPSVVFSESIFVKNDALLVIKGNE